MTKQALTGWGRTAPSVADLVAPATEADVMNLLNEASPILARGLGRSYGDAAQVAGGTVASNRLLAWIGTIDADGVVSVGAGTSIDELLHESIPKGWFVPVTPGTRQVTIGGAIAADVHGKNHHADGSFGEHVRSMRLATPSGMRVIDAASEPELFWATVGGMGLTGIVTEATIQLIPITSDQISVDTERFGDLDAIMAAMVARDAEYRYSVAWVDCMTKGASMGRGVLTRGDHASAEAASRLNAPGRPKLAVPFDPPSGLLNTWSIRAFNEAWFRRAPQHRVGELQDLSTFFHPLDGVRGWNRMYGKRGFVQYQFVVPDERAECVVRAIERLSSSGVPSFLAVLKRFGPGNPGLLSFPMAGWTLALDLPVGPAALPGVLDELDRLVLEAGGRVYLAKDARLDAATAQAMYPRIGELRRIKALVDPNGVVTSDLARRLEITGE
jgi:decaprenylphospho-beta-D-ribofuranose 2-oxidase